MQTDSTADAILFLPTGELKQQTFNSRDRPEKRAEFRPAQLSHKTTKICTLFNHAEIYVRLSPNTSLPEQADLSTAEPDEIRFICLLMN
ncbi:hypothetical protein [uncultured Cohaesibacter sp.]|uniref:hypothetical protein n=1 Tax=uncultured Cohaesibacter sp. TaxID=1002546 RepID=UPI0029C7C885|nr:hypothetical protein [uncultured Cohaesibacter sp.]